MRFIWTFNAVVAGKQSLTCAKFSMLNIGRGRFAAQLYFPESEAENCVLFTAN